MNEDNLYQLSELLYGNWGELRKEVRDELSKDAYAREYGLSVKRHRRKVFKQLKKLSKQSFVKSGFPDYLGGEGDPGSGVAVFEELVLRDPSLQIKYGVHFGLFGSAILNLGTEEQHKRLLPDVISLKTPGVFAMTETGHGSDVSSIRTEARYEPMFDSFFLQTPDRDAWKDYLGNAAVHGKAAVVFAQLYVGEENYGVHAFYVPIRDGLGRLLPGIAAQDDGAKGGLNGIDNGRLAFHGVSVPRNNLLGKFGYVDEEGKYTSSIQSRGRRFFTMLSTLVQGRVSLVGAVSNAQKLALSVAVPYAFTRKQFKGSDGEEVRLIDYPLHKQRLVPALVEAYALSFFHQDLLEHFQEVFNNPEPAAEERSALETHAAAAKAYATWTALKNIQVCREACGGQGYLAENQLATLHSDLDVYATFEGDNHVLLQLVAKRLLDDLKDEWQHASARTYIDYAFQRVGIDAVNRIGLRKVLQEFKDHGSLERSMVYFLNRDNIQHLLSHRVSKLVNELGKQIRRSPDAGQAFIDNQVLAVEAAQAHTELLVWESMRKAVEKSQGLSGEVNEALGLMLDAFGMQIILGKSEWYLREGTLSTVRVEAMREYYDKQLVPSIAEVSDDLVSAFDMGALVTAPIISKQDDSSKQ